MYEYELKLKHNDTPLCGVKTSSPLLVVPVESWSSLPLPAVV